MSLCQERKNTEGSRKTDFDQAAIMALDEIAKEYCHVKFNISKSSFQEFQSITITTKDAFILVYDAGVGLHTATIRINLNFYNPKQFIINYNQLE
jgi:hypothetical protein